MSMIVKFLKESVSIIVGKSAEEIVDLIYKPKHVNEFLLSKKLNLTINQTRNILYKLSDYGIVSFVRKKDKRKGWYTYFWKMEPIKSLEFFKNSLVKKIEQTTYQIRSKETKDFYICERCNIELNEETALIHSFTCNECGGLFSLKDNSKSLKDLQKNLEKLNEDLLLVEKELEKEREKSDKVKFREAKKQKLIKDSARKKKREESKKLREKVSGKKIKKPLKNKVRKTILKIKPKKKTVGKTKSSSIKKKIIKKTKSSSIKKKIIKKTKSSSIKKKKPIKKKSNKLKK